MEKRGKPEKRRERKEKVVEVWKFPLIPSSNEVDLLHEELRKPGQTPQPSPAILTRGLAQGKQLNKLLNERR